MTQAPSSHSYAIIYNIQSLPNPFLVEVHRNTNIHRRDLNVYGQNVIMLPRIMNCICRVILHNQAIMQYKDLLKKCIFNIMTRSTRSIRIGTIEEICLQNIIDYEIKKRIYSKTRGGNARKTAIKEKWKTIHLYCLKEESHMALSFVNDVLRSLTELKYVMNNYAY